MYETMRYWMKAILMGAEERDFACVAAPTEVVVSCSLKSVGPNATLSG